MPPVPAASGLPADDRARTDNRAYVALYGEVLVMA